MTNRQVRVSQVSAGIAAAVLLVALGAGRAAFADDAPPPPPPTPPVPSANDVPPEAAPVENPDAAVSLEDRACELERCLNGIPEIRWPIYDPSARFQIPWTGQGNPRERNWTVFGAETLTYDSNLFLAQRHEQDDWISNTSAGFSYRREGAEYWSLATLSLSYAAYFQHSEEDALNLFGTFDFGWKGASMYASVSDRVARLQNPIVVRDNLFAVVSQNLESYWQNTLTARVGYECVKWRSELEYSFDVFDSREGVSQAYNHQDHSISGRFDYYLSEKTSLGAYLGTRFIPFDSSTQRDFDVWSGGATFSWRPSAKFGLVGSLGFATTKSSDGGSDHTALSGSLDGSLEVAEYTSVGLGWSRNFEPGLGADDQIVDIIHAQAHTMLNSCWQLTTSAGVQIGNVQGSTADGIRDYDLWFLDATVHHNLSERMGLDLGWQFRHQNASDSGIDFDQNRLTIGISAAL